MPFIFLKKTPNKNPLPEKTRKNKKYLKMSHTKNLLNKEKKFFS